MVVQPLIFDIGAEKVMKRPFEDCEQIDTPQCLWTPSKEILETSHLTKFIDFVNKKYDDLSITDFHSLWMWSTTNISGFWEAVWDYSEIKYSSPYSTVVDNSHKMPGAKWFIDAKLNFAENLLRYHDSHRALIFQSEISKTQKSITYAELYDRVKELAQRLRQLGVKPNDRVVGFLPNIPETVIAMLAATSIGAIWSSCSPDFGIQGVLDRFAQIEPKVLFVSDGYFYKGKRIDIFDKLSSIIKGLSSLEKVVMFSYTISKDYRLGLSTLPKTIYYEDFIDEIEGDLDKKINFEQLPFDHPVYIMYSSGTTGLPKCLVQGCGVLLNHVKEHMLHINLQRNDTIFYFTTTGWMMWNWLVSSLFVGAEIILFDGNPLYPDAASLWKLAEQQKITIFGTSARYLSAIMESGCNPRTECDLKHLRMIASTGSPATTTIFNFVYKEIKEDVQFASISGGTDLNGCFALGCTNLPVYDGELQCRGLGLDVAIFNDDGIEVHCEKGELVCLQAFPSMPLYFWNDPTGSKYYDAYFDTFPNVWRHGDFAEITARNGVTIYGRSDATLKPGGVRIGTADIYKVIETMKELSDSVVVGKNYLLEDGSPDVKIVLFVKLAKDIQLTNQLQNIICKRIREQASPRHVPSLIFECPDIPYTLSGKKVEIAVKKAIEGQIITNKNALANPDSLDFFIKIACQLK